MVRKTKEEAEQTRCMLLDAALEVFSEKGFVRSSLKDIATRAGVTRGAIYWHFKDKADLFEALSEDISDCTDTSKSELLEKKFTNLEELSEGIVNYFAMFEDDARFRTFHELTSYKIEYHDELQGALERARVEKRAVLKHFALTFARFQAEGEMRKDLEPYSAAVMLVSMVWGLIEVWLSDHDLFSIKNEGPVMLARFLEGYKNNPDRG